MKIRMALALSVSFLVVVYAFSYELYEHDVASPGKAVGFTVANLTGDLGNTFSKGSIQAFGQNSTTILVSGTEYYYKPTDFSFPALIALDSLTSVAPGKNLTPVADQYFHEGSVFGTAWNGSSWILTGEAAWGNVDEGAAVQVHGSSYTNLTPTLGKYFQDGGIWFDAWNGTGWIFGGNNDHAASLVALYNGSVINYTGLLGPTLQNSWIQLIEWNGTSWLVGGHGIFGFITHGRYSDMLGKSEFKSSGVYSALFSGGEWVVGGGPPAGLEVVKGSQVISNISLPSYFNRWVNAVAPFDGGFIAGGEASGNQGEMMPALYYFVEGSSWDFVNLTVLLPGSFNGGQVQFLSNAHMGNITGILIAGQGNYNEKTGSSSGALALLDS